MLGRTSSVERGSARLAERRRNRRRRTFVAIFILFLLLLTAIVWGLQQSAVRISDIEVLGADASFSSYATSTMSGLYFGVIPRDSIFFFPEEKIRFNILSANNDIAAVSIVRSGFTDISIKVDYRVPVARWCGLSPTAGVDEYCYVFDSSGVIFSIVSTTTQTINTFRLYAPLVGENLEPLRATVLHTEKLPAIFDFARQLSTFGSPVTSIIIRDGEVDDILKSGTRLTYVLGREQDAFTALVSARDNLNLSDGSVDYIDLRFDGKVYLKKKTEPRP